MRILFVCQHYWPETFASTDICEELVARGHDVTVLTGQPNYPEGFLYPGYEGGNVRREERNGVHIVRSKLHPRKRGVLHRVWNYYSFSWHASREARRLAGPFDVVIAYQTTPVMMANPAIAYARKTGTPLFLHCVDIWPECLTVGGIRRGSAVYNHYKRVSRDIYDAADSLAVTSEMFAGYLRDQVGVTAERIVYIPQYAESVFEEAGECGDVDLDEALFPADSFNFMFAGNVGAAQSVDTIVRAAALLADSPVRFHIVGDGSELAACKELAASLVCDNVVFHGKHPLEEMPAYYAAADAMIASFAKNPVLAYTLPKKIPSYMAAGKPIIGTALGASRDAIDQAQCGLCCDAEDYRGLAELCRAFAVMPQDELRRMGENARLHYQAHFSQESFFTSLESELSRLVSGER